MFVGVLLHHKIHHYTSVVAAPGLADPPNSLTLSAVAGGGRLHAVRWVCSSAAYLPYQDEMNVGPLSSP